MKKTILFFYFFAAVAFAAEVKKPIEKAIEKPLEKPFVPTQEQKAKIAEGKKILSKTKNKKKPSKHLQDKMNQSGMF